jgi:hypothetical protein
MNRRESLTVAAAIGAHGAWGFRSPRPSRSAWQDRRDLYPEGVASGDAGPVQVAEAFTHLAFPAHFRVELAWAKLLGAVLLRPPLSFRTFRTPLFDIKRTGRVAFRCGAGTGAKHATS